MSKFEEIQARSVGRIYGPQCEKAYRMNKSKKKCPECGGKIKKSLGDDRYIPIHYYCMSCNWTSN